MSNEKDIVHDDNTFKARAEHEANTTKDVVGPLAISPELLAQAKKKRPYNRKAKNTVVPVEVRTSAAEPSAVTESLPVEDVVAEREWYCSTCRENIADRNVMKIGAGTDRWAVFCPQCQRSFGFLDQAVLDKVADLIKNNPTGK